ncbi:MAG: CBS domain-containing protein [Chitinophagaceae bacterium]
MAKTGFAKTVASINADAKTDLPQVKSSNTIEYCMQLMSDKNVRYLPVAENGEVIGIISINDVVKETILAQQETINNLQSYLYSNS